VNISAAGPQPFVCPAGSVLNETAINTPVNAAECCMVSAQQQSLRVLSHAMMLPTLCVKMSVPSIVYLHWISRCSIASRPSRSCITTSGAASRFDEGHHLCCSFVSFPHALCCALCNYSRPSPR
jgi:hypothetical protein